MERVKLRRQKADDKDLFETSSLFSDDSDKFIDIPDIPPLEGDKRVKEGKGLKILPPNKLLTRLPILLALFCISKTKSLKKFTTI